MTKEKKKTLSERNQRFKKINCKKIGGMMRENGKGLEAVKGRERDEMK